MSPTLLALLLYAAWTLLLLGLIAGHRSVLVLRGRPANRFTPAGDDVSPFAARLCRAHANCTENLPIAGAVLVVAQLSGHADITDPLAFVLVGARLGQSVTHLISTSHPAVVVRFGFFLGQVGLLGWWSLQLVIA